MPGFQPGKNTLFYAGGIDFENAAQLFLTAVLNEFIRQTDAQQPGSMPKFKSMFGDHTAKTAWQGIFFNCNDRQIAQHRVSKHFNIEGPDETRVDESDADSTALQFLGCHGGCGKSMAKCPY